jgi:hypothetical protein
MSSVFGALHNGTIFPEKQWFVSFRMESVSVPSALRRTACRAVFPHHF